MVDAAKRIAEGGIDALTMSALAAELGVTPMAAYRHVRNREHLVALVLDSALSEVEVPPGGRWTVRLRTLHTAIVDALDRYPGLFFAVPADAHPPLDNATRLLEGYLAILLDGGFSEEHAALAYTGLYYLAVGVVIHHARYGDPSPLSMGMPKTEAETRVSILDRFDEVTPSAASYRTFALDVYINGLEGVLRAQRRSAAQTAR